MDGPTLLPRRLTTVSKSSRNSLQKSKAQRWIQRRCNSSWLLHPSRCIIHISSHVLNPSSLRTKWEMKRRKVEQKQISHKLHASYTAVRLDTVLGNPAIPFTASVSLMVFSSPHFTVTRIGIMFNVRAHLRA